MQSQIGITWANFSLYRARSLQVYRMRSGENGPPQSDRDRSGSSLFAQHSTASDYAQELRQTVTGWSPCTLRDLVVADCVAAEKNRRGTWRINYHTKSGPPQGVMQINVAEISVDSSR